MKERFFFKKEYGDTVIFDCEEKLPSGKIWTFRKVKAGSRCFLCGKEFKEGDFCYVGRKTGRMAHQKCLLEWKKTPAGVKDNAEMQPNGYGGYSGYWDFGEIVGFFEAEHEKKS